MRLIMASESLLKEQSRTSSIEALPPVQQEVETSSFFMLNPFRDFASRKFRELLKRENMDHLILWREEVLEDRRKKQGLLIKDMLKKKRISPKTYRKEQLRLEKWVTRQRNDLEMAKIDMQKGWRGTYDTVLRTQRDLMFMNQNSRGVGRNGGFTALANSFSHDCIYQRYLLVDNATNIKVIDNYTSESQATHLSQSALVSEGSSAMHIYTPFKDLQVSIDFRNSQT